MYPNFIFKIQNIGNFIRIAPDQGGVPKNTDVTSNFWQKWTLRFLLQLVNYQHVTDFDRVKICACWFYPAIGHRVDCTAMTK